MCCNLAGSAFRCGLTCEVTEVSSFFPRAARGCPAGTFNVQAGATGSSPTSHSLLSISCPPIGLSRLFKLSYWPVDGQIYLPHVSPVATTKGSFASVRMGVWLLCLALWQLLSLLLNLQLKNRKLLSSKMSARFLLFVPSSGPFARGCSSWLLLRFPLCFHQVNRYSHFNFPLTSFSSRLFRSLLVPLWPRPLFFSVFVSSGHN